MLTVSIGDTIINSGSIVNPSPDNINISWPSSTAFHTLVIYRVTESNIPFIHMLIINIPSNNVTEGTVVLPYVPLISSTGRGVCVVDLYIQKQILPTLTANIRYIDLITSVKQLDLLLDSRVIFQMETFPYKREFINVEELWKNAMTLDLAEFKTITVPKTGGWFLPRGFRWEFKGKPTAIVVSDMAYDKVDKLVDYFSEEARMQAYRQNCSSPYNFYQNNYQQIVVKAEELQRVDTEKLPFRHWLRESVYHLTPECTTFKISVTKAIFKYFKSERVLDPSAGWGDRILGAASANVQIYNGIDPNPSLRQAYDEMISFIRSHGQDVGDLYSVVTEDFLQVNLGNNQYDMVFTSPPFFDYEVYSSDPRQSINGRTTVESWTRDFLLPYVTRAWHSLIINGIFALYISDVRSGKYVYNMWKHITHILQGNFLGIIAVTQENLSHGFPIWVWRKK